MAPRGPADVAAASSRRFTLTPRAHHATVTVPEGGVTSGFTTSACARGDLFTVKPEVCPTPYRARATGYITPASRCGRSRASNFSLNELFVFDV